MKPRSTFVFPCALVLATLSFGGAAAGLPGNSSTVCTAPTAEVSRALRRATNEARAKARRCGSTRMAAAPKLRWSRELTRTARGHSRDMARNNFFSHTGSDGLQVWDRAVAEGYAYRYIGENIAAGYASVGSVQAGWLSSPGHCKNLMSANFTHMGVSCVRDASSDYRDYWTIVFGRTR